MNERPIYKVPPGARGGGRPGPNRRLGGLACLACVLTLAGATLGNGLISSSGEIEAPAPDQVVVDSGGDRQSIFSAIRAQVARLALAVVPAQPAEQEPGEQFGLERSFAEGLAADEPVDAPGDEPGIMEAEAAPAELIEAAALAVPAQPEPVVAPAPVFARTLSTAEAPVATAPAEEPPVEGAEVGNAGDGVLEAAALASPSEPSADKAAAEETPRDSSGEPAPDVAFASPAPSDDDEKPRKPEKERPRPEPAPPSAKLRSAPPPPPPPPPPDEGDDEAKEEAPKHQVPHQDPPKQKAPKDDDDGGPKAPPPANPKPAPPPPPPKQVKKDDDDDGPKRRSGGERQQSVQKSKSSDDGKKSKK